MGEKLKNNSTKFGNKTRLSILYLFNIILKVLARAARQVKEIKGIQTRKEELKGMSFADDMMYT